LTFFVQLFRLRLIEVFNLESEVRGSDEGRQQVHQVEYQVVEHHEQISHKPEIIAKIRFSSFSFGQTNLLRTKQNKN
jgi:hypothetical protein